MANRPKRNKKVQISLSQPPPNTREPEEIFSHNPEETTEQPPEKEEPPRREGSPDGNDGEGSPTDPNSNSNPLTTQELNNTLRNTLPCTHTHTSRRTYI